MRKFINILVLVVALVGSVSAQSLDDLSKKIYDLSFEAINKGINDYEEQLEKQELEELEELKKNLEKVKKTLEEAKKIEEETKKLEEETKKLEESNFEENCNILAAVAISYPSDNKVWLKCYCYPLEDYIWYTIFYDSNWWLKLAYDNNGEIGDVFYAAINKDLDYIKVKDDISGEETAAIKLTNAVDSIVVVQDIHEPRDFTITW